MLKEFNFQSFLYYARKYLPLFNLYYMLDLFLLMYNTTLDTFDIYEIFGLAFTINVHN